MMLTVDIKNAHRKWCAFFMFKLLAAAVVPHQD